jgi:hypothetical protein
MSIAHTRFSDILCPLNWTTFLSSNAFHTFTLPQLAPFAIHFPSSDTEMQQNISATVHRNSRLHPIMIVHISASNLSLVVTAHDVLFVRAYDQL